MLALLAASYGEFHPTTVDLAAAPYKFSIVDWELSRLPSKWLYRVREATPGGPAWTRQQRIAQAQEFFQMGQELGRLDRELLFPEAHLGASASPPREARELREAMARLEERRRSGQGLVEATLESEVAAVLAREGLATRWGVFPPVSAVFTSPPHVLVISPRDRIARQQDVLLRPGLGSAEREEMEERIFREADLSALVTETGGVALYPSVVLDSAGLHHAVVTMTHEWLHQWLIFRPLGRAFWSSPEMASLNETAATIAGQELGDLVYTRLTGQVVDRPPPWAPEARDPDAFDFRAEMGETRRRTEELLAQGQIEEAEAYMEERRQLFVAHGHLIRKLNQAYFAFHGTYATSPASISPIGDQVQELRARSDSVGDFLRTVARFGSYQEFLDYLEG